MSRVGGGRVIEKACLGRCGRVIGCVGAVEIGVVGVRTVWDSGGENWGVAPGACYLAWWAMIWALILS